MKTKSKKVTIKTLGEKVARGEKIIGMECHDTPSAMMAEELGMDLLCVGSPGPMGLFGHKSMNTVDFQEQLYFLEAVLRGASPRLFAAICPIRQLAFRRRMPLGMPRKSNGAVPMASTLSHT